MSVSSGSMPTRRGLLKGAAVAGAGIGAGLWTAPMVSAVGVMAAPGSPPPTTTTSSTTTSSSTSTSTSSTTTSTSTSTTSSTVPFQGPEVQGVTFTQTPPANAVLGTGADRGTSPAVAVTGYNVEKAVKIGAGLTMAGAAAVLACRQEGKPAPADGPGPDEPTT